MTKTKFILLTLNGFHGYQTHKVKATGNKIELGEFEHPSRGCEVSISPSAAQKFKCESEECKCGEGIESKFNCYFSDFESGEVELKGFYPHR
jgi:hypothetical protein